MQAGTHPAYDRRVYAEYVAMLVEDERKQEQESATSWPPSMESLGLDPSSEFDCEAYAGYLEAEAEAEAAPPIPLDMALSSALTLMNRAAPREHRRFAAAYLHVVAQDRAYFAAPLLAPSRLRPRRGRTRRRDAPVRRRLRVRSGSRGDPPPDDEEPDAVDLLYREAVAA